MRYSPEHSEAVALCQWWGYQANRLKVDPRLLIHLANEGKRTPWGGKRLKDEGLRPGAPDYFLAIGRDSYHGLWIELKAPKGQLQPSQREMLRLLNAGRYIAVCAYGANEAIGAIEAYLKWPGGLLAVSPLPSKS